MITILNELKDLVEVASPVLLAVITYLTFRLKKQQERAMAHTKKIDQTIIESREMTDAKLDKLKTCGEATREVVNNSLSLQLEKNADLSRELAAETGYPRHVEQAKAAAEVHQAHLAKQAEIDERILNDGDKELTY